MRKCSSTAASQSWCAKCPVIPKCLIARVLSERTAMDRYSSNTVGRIWERIEKRARSVRAWLNNLPCPCQEAHAELPKAMGKPWPYATLASTREQRLTFCHSSKEQGQSFFVGAFSFVCVCVCVCAHWWIACYRSRRPWAAWCKLSVTRMPQTTVPNQRLRSIQHAVRKLLVRCRLRVAGRMMPASRCMAK